jgi:hypothetical protein
MKKIWMIVNFEAIEEDDAITAVFENKESAEAEMSRLDKSGEIYAGKVIEKTIADSWISVNDELPVHERVVLVWKPLQDPISELGARTLAYYTHDLSDWFTGIRRASGITHWMPLPAPPTIK